MRFCPVGARANHRAAGYSTAALKAIAPRRWRGQAGESETEFARRPARECLRERNDAPMIRFLDQRLIRGVGRVGSDGPERRLSRHSSARAADDQHAPDGIRRGAARPAPSAALAKTDVLNPRHQGCAAALRRRQVGRQSAGQIPQKSCSTQSAVGSPAPARSGATSTLVPAFAGAD